METLSTQALCLSPHHNPNTAFIALSSGHSPISHSTVSFVIHRCRSIIQLKQIHAQMIRAGIFFNTYSASKLLTASARSPFSDLEYACQVFDQIPQPNLYCWNTLIRAYASSPDPIHSIRLFIQMVSTTPHCPNEFTFPFVIKAAGDSCLRTSRALHGTVIKSSLALDIFVSNSLIHCYSSCGDLESAYKVFVLIGEKDVVSWNSMITGFAQKGSPTEALALFQKMEAEEVEANGVTMVGVLSACAKKSDLEFGRWICSYIEANGIHVDLTLYNAMLDMYTKCGSMEDAKLLFEKMEEKDVVSWTTMLDGYARSKDYDSAQRLFNALPRKEIAAWNVLISSYEQNGNPKEALAVFRELLLVKAAKPDQITLVSALSACAQLGAVDLGGWIHVYIKKQGMRLNCHLTSSLIDMYSKCGYPEKALNVFNSVEERDVFVWSSMIGGLAMNGRGEAAIDLFSKMQKARVQPNGVTFTNLLCACSHRGMVHKGERFFNHMESIYGVLPEDHHYACMVDILGRAGHLDNALKFIETMPISPSASVWGALLGACRIHGNLELAELACGRLIKLEPRNHGAYVLLSNIYARRGKWDAVSELRKLMRVTGLQKEPGCSSIEVNGSIHEFLVGDNSHPFSKEIYTKLHEVVGRLKLAGYEPNKSEILQLVEEEDMKEHSLMLHSEKLAIVFGLISTKPSEPIRIIKNLRVCRDCHSVAKLISELYDREILLRDVYRFHHFRKGRCSCMEYW